MIQIRQLQKAYMTGATPLPVLRGVDLHIRPGEAVAIMGSSGSGKSTLLNIIGLLDSHDSGEYHLDGQEVRALSESAAARMRNRLLGFVFQSFHLLADRDAVENVALPLFYRGIARKERNTRAVAALQQVGLGDRLDHLPNQLSGGQKQRVAIARALIGEPRVLLADEPTGALDTTTSDEIMDLLLGLNADGLTLVVVTHEAEVAERCQRTIVLRDGQVVSRGAPVDASAP